MRRITLLFLLMAIVCGAFIACQKNENSTIVIEKVTAGIERDDVFEEYNVTRIGPDNERPFECYCAYKMMGYNYEKCGYKDVRSFLADMMENRKKQLAIFCAYLKNTEGDRYLKALDWTGFASYYDSAQYAVDRLDERLEQAYAKYAE